MNNTAYPDVGQTIRQPATAILGIDSADRYTFDSSQFRIDNQPEYNFSLYKGQSVLNGFIKRLALTEINMEYNVPNVNTYNNKFGIVFSGTDLSGVSEYEVVISVPTGFYTPIELTTYLQTQINTTLTSAGVLDPGKVADVVITLDPKTLYITIDGKGTAVGGADLTLKVPTNFGVPVLSKTTMYEMLGLKAVLDNYAIVNLFPNPNWVGNYASFLYTRYIDIISNNLTKKQEVKDSSTQPPEVGASNLLARLYVGNSGLSESRFDVSGVGCNIVGTRPFQMYKEYQTPKYIYWDSREFINLIDIKVYDDAGRPLYEQASEVGVAPDYGFTSGNTAEFQITLLASEN
jgi:hypothetical protein